MAKSAPTKNESVSASKKCPECFTYVPLDAKVCPSCKKPIGKPGAHGLAEKPTNWKAYIVCALAWIVFIGYVIWAFF